jgi:hypothetical protein
MCYTDYLKWSWSCSGLSASRREQYTCVIMTTVTEPEDVTALDTQLRLHNDILDFNVFPNSEKT